MPRVLALALCILPADGFTLTGSKAAMTVRRVSYLSEVEGEGQISKKESKEAPSDPRAPSGFDGGTDGNAGPANYDGFVDAEGFDGGDGQVGVVGDGTMAMATFDKTQAVAKSNRLAVKDNAIGGSESKSTQKNVWGFSTGYADELKKRGMVDVDEYGEDRLQRRRQQLENFQNQQQVRAQKEGALRDLAELQGKDYAPSRQGEYLAGMGAKKPANEVLVVGGAQRENSAAGNDLVAGAVDGELSFVARLEQIDGTTLKVDNELSRYVDYEAGFVDGSSGAFSVSPAAGTFNRRGSDPVEFVVKFKPTNFAESFEGTLVVQTEDFTKTYRCVGKLN
ncbi:hypothetical protein M885DRAFT_539728 [Pelagophyceae sp. CCMP2097]|nr:hypothetical protein M885DRAFT_539728 [Pelagophyceae sp. CCMP2097]